MKTVAEYLSELKNKHDASYQNVADATGISTGTLSHIGTGRTKQPDPETLRRLAVYFGKGDTNHASIIYQNFMSYAGYLDALPRRDSDWIVAELSRLHPEILDEILQQESD